MCDVKIEKLNNVYAKVDCEPSIAQELNDFFTFTVPNAQFSPAFKNKFWNGKISLYNLKTKQIYLGLIPYIKKFCKDNNYSYEYEEDKEVYPIDTKNLANALSLPMEPRDYQYLASSVGLTKKRTVLISPTASGKSLIIYMMIRHLLNTGKKRGLLIVPTINLVTQMYSDFENYSSKNGWKVDHHCQKIYGGESKIAETRFRIHLGEKSYVLPGNLYIKTLNRGRVLVKDLTVGDDVDESSIPQ